ncbi:single-stranded DNA-binding protein [Nocardioides sp. 1609]|uniref:single-stranded DNA-binding protein n=1 Tax=Nocardioides sp. 1609 TaxID=2508327 RepID=UPI00106F505B|nr:single-stranded DNA-binding protein [Nocardioides sp. 1609]
MSPHTKDTREGTSESLHEAVEAVNDVRLVGRLAAPAEAKELPSGDTLVSFRVVVDRPPRQRQRQRVDALECVVWTGRVKRSVGTWREGDLVEVSGSIRRRFFRTAVGTGSRVEVEVRSGRVLRRARSG